MLRQQRGTVADRPPTDTLRSLANHHRSLEGVHVRNYDHRAGHSVHVRVFDAAGRPAMSERCYLAPGQSRRLTAPIDPGDHRVRVRVDGVERVDGRYRLDGSPSGTAVVELGNGVVSVTEGANGLTDD